MTPANPQGRRQQVRATRTCEDTASPLSAVHQRNYPHDFCGLSEDRTWTLRSRDLKTSESQRLSRGLSEDRANREAQIALAIIPLPKVHIAICWKARQFRPQQRIVDDNGKGP